MNGTISIWVVLALFLIPFFNDYAVHTQDRDGNPPRSIQPLPDNREELLKAVVNGWRQNRSQLDKLAFDVERTTYEIPVLLVFGKPDERKRELFNPEKTTRITCSYRYDREVLKEEYVTPADISFGTVTVARTGRYLQYVPRLKQAWISTGIADINGRNPIDLRLAGFQPPVSDLGRWLEAWDIESIKNVADASGRAVVRLNGKWLAPHGKKMPMTIDFDPAFNFLPVAVIDRYPQNETVLSIATLDYQPIKDGKAWFLKHERVIYYPTGVTSDPERGRPSGIVEHVVLGTPKTEIEFAPDEFDPLLGPNTLLVGDIRIQPVSPNKPVRASKMTRETPEVPMRRPGTIYP